MIRHLLVDEIGPFGGNAFTSDPGSVSSRATSEAFLEDLTHSVSEEWTWVQR